MRRIFGVLLVMALLLTGCSNNHKEILLDSSVSCIVTVPQNFETEYPVFFQFPFYRIYSGEDIYSEQLNEQSTFVVGEDAFFVGDNVDSLKGAIVSVDQVPLRDIIEDDFYDTLARSYAMEYLGKNSLVVDDNYIKSVKKTIAPFVNDAFLLSFHIMYEGSISNGANINSLSIPSMNLDFSFDCMRIELMKIPENVHCEKDNGLIFYTSGDGFLSGPIIVPPGYTFIDGVASAEIKGISLFSANSVCEVVTEDNYIKYQSLEDVYGKVFTKQKLNDYTQNEKINLEFSYVFTLDKIVLRDMDVVMVSLISQIVDEEGHIYWDYHYEPNVSEGPFLLRKLLH